jgi:predicted nucleic acid-binding protein
LRDEPGDLIVSLPVATEVDYLLGRRGGRAARLRFHDDMASGRFVVAGLSVDDFQTISDLERRYADLDAGLADLSIVVVAARHRTDRIVTFDQHFRALRPLDGSAAFVMLP